MQRLFLCFALVFLGYPMGVLPAEAEDAGDAYRVQGFELNKAGKCREAIPYLTKAIEVDGKNYNAFIERGFAWYELGQYDKAIADEDQALRLEPNHAILHNNRGYAWCKKGNYDKALADFEQSVTIDPKYADGYDAIAWLYATCPEKKYRDGKKAFENASKAYELSDGTKWRFYDTLAAAYAESGDFDAAKEWEGKAIALATADKDKEKCRSHLELYKQDKPYRDEPKKK